MEGVFLAESAVLIHLQLVGCVLFVLHCVVVALTALCAGQSNTYSHVGTSSYGSLVFVFCLGGQKHLPPSLKVVLMRFFGRFAQRVL